MRLGYSCYHIDKLEDALSFLKNHKKKRFNDAIIEYFKGECLKDLKNMRMQLVVLKPLSNGTTKIMLPIPTIFGGVLFKADYSKAVDSLNNGHKDKWAYQNLRHTLV